MNTVHDRLGYDLRRLRRDKGWTQERLAKKLRMRQQRISLMERGRINFTLNTLRRIAAVFNRDLRIDFK